MRSSYYFSPRSLAAFVLLGCFYAGSLAVSAPSVSPEKIPHQHAGTIRYPAIHEASGLAASRRSTDLLWTHNDSGGEPLLFALDSAGALRGTVRVRGVKNNDWEDIASFEENGEAYLLIADVGDNFGSRKTSMLHVLLEPDPSQLGPEKTSDIPVAWSISIRYPDGPHDCEAVSVDAASGQVFLLTKRTSPPLLFAVPLHGPGGAKAKSAELLGSVTHLPQPTAQQKMLPLPSSRFRAYPTAMDFSPDGTLAVVLTYGDVLLFHRKNGQAWSDALMSEPEILAPHGLGQAEGACFSHDGLAIYVTGEGKEPPLLKYDIRPLTR
jgi:hypothetical protein